MEDKPAIQNQNQAVNRLSNGQYPKGISGNPKGRNKCPELIRLKYAIHSARKMHGGIDILTHAVLRAYKSDVVLCAILNKLLPNLATTEGGAKMLQAIFVGGANGSNGNTTEQQFAGRMREYFRECVTNGNNGKSTV
jgi:hypothetical protein